MYEICRYLKFTTSKYVVNRSKNCIILSRHALHTQVFSQTQYTTIGVQTLGTEDKGNRCKLYLTTIQSILADA